jgi:hypothetical protein
MKGPTDSIIGSEKVIKTLWNSLKLRKGDFALIAAHAKLRIVDGRGGEGFSFPMKGMTKGALNVHLSKTVNLPIRIKRLTRNKGLKIKDMIK